MALPAVVPVHAASVPYDLSGVWQFNDVGYIHAMLIDSFNPSTGAFSGEGFYTGGIYTWTITGTEGLDGSISFLLTVVTGAPGCTIETVTGSVTSPTTMSGTGFQSCYGPVTWSATAATQVLNIKYSVTNDEDSGFAGYWALDSYNVIKQVWQDPTIPTNFYVFSNYAGKFTGYCSPVSGTPDSKAAAGTFHGGYFAEFNDASAEGNNNGQANGNLATYNYGGTVADVKLCSYGAGQVGPTSPLDWFGTYFPHGSNFNEYIWGWTYNYKGQTWVNAYTGSSGDIVV